MSTTHEKAPGASRGHETEDVIRRAQGNITAETAQEPITLDESKRLIELENVIAAGQQTFKEVGTALAEIRDARLYKSDYASFEDYCVHKWGFGKSYGYQLIESAAVAAEVSAITDIKTESQARALAKVPKAKRASVITQASKRGPLTAKKIREVAAPADDEPSHIRTADEELSESPAPLESPDFTRKFKSGTKSAKAAERWWIFSASPEKRGQFFSSLLSCSGMGKGSGKVAVPDKERFTKSVMFWLEMLSRTIRIAFTIPR
jgi:hypothetical protein